MPQGNQQDSALDDFQQQFVPQEDQQLNEDFPTTTEETTGLDENFQQSQQIDTAQTQQQQQPRKNRHHRRLEDKLERERVSNIQLAAQLKAVTEAAKFNNELGGTTIDQRLIELYGDDDNGKKAARITQSLLVDAAANARKEALEDFKKFEQERQDKLREDREFIDESLEDLEDAHGVDLTSDTPQGRRNRTEFLDMVNKFSPKDESGAIKSYADFDQVFEVYQQTRKTNTNRNKDLASRGMARGGAATHKTGDKAVENYLRESGII